MPSPLHLPHCQKGRVVLDLGRKHSVLLTTRPHTSAAPCSSADLSKCTNSAGTLFKARSHAASQASRRCRGQLAAVKPGAQLVATGHLATRWISRGPRRSRRRRPAACAHAVNCSLLPCCSSSACLICKACAVLMPGHSACLLLYWGGRHREAHAVLVWRPTLSCGMSLTPVAEPLVKLSASSDLSADSVVTPWHLLAQTSLHLDLLKSRNEAGSLLQ